MEQYDYDVDQSLRIASGMSRTETEDREAGSGTHTPSVNSKSAMPGSGVQSAASSSNRVPESASCAPSVSDYGEAGLTINTRRRLIRKPLPDLPSSSKREGGSKLTAESSTDGVLRREELREVSHTSVFVHRHEDAKKPAATLMQARQRTRDGEEKERAMLEWWPTVPAEALGTSSSHRSDTGTCSRLSARCRRHLLHIVEVSLRTASPDAHTDMLFSLSTSIVAALDSCLDTVATPDTLSAIHQTASILWRVEALVRSEGQLKDSKGGIGNVLDILGLRWSSFVPWLRAGISEDINVASLNSLDDLIAIRPLLASKRQSSTSSVGAQISTEQRRRKRDVAMQLLSSAFSVPSTMSTDTGELDIDTNAQTPLPTQSKAMAHQKTPLNRPSFAVKPATPTVALAGPSDLPSYFDRVDHGPSPAVSAEGESNKRDPSTPTQAPERPSMLADRLSMQLRNASKSNSDTSVPRFKSATVRDSSARSSRSDFTFPAEQKTVPALTLTACKIHHYFEQEKLNDEAESRPSRASTIKGTLRRLENLSTTSGTSNSTVKGPREEQDSLKRPISGDVAVRWVPDEFVGPLLSRNPFAFNAGSVAQDTDHAMPDVKIVGGTFVISGAAQASVKEALPRVLEVAFYAAAAMLLETTFLTDFGLSPETLPEAEINPKETTSDGDAEKPSPSSATPPDDSGSIPAAPAQASSSNPNWHRSIWHMFGHTHEAQVKADSAAKPRGSEGTRVRDRLQSTMQYGRLRKLLHSFAPPSTLDSGQSDADVDRVIGVLAVDASANGALMASESNHQAVNTSIDAAESEPHHLSAYRHRRSDHKTVDTDTNFLERMFSTYTFNYAVLYGNDIAMPYSTATRELSGGPPIISSSRFSTSSNSRASSVAFASSTTGQTASTLSTSTKQSDAPSVAMPKASIAAKATTSSWNSSLRRVRFYEHDEGPAADTCLGQALEEMAAKTVTLQHNALQADKGRSNVLNDSITGSNTFKLAQYLSDCDRLFVCGSVVPQSPPQPSKSGASTPHELDRRLQAIKSTKEEVSESRASVVEKVDSVDDGESVTTSTQKSRTNFSKTILMWHADVRTGRQSKPIAMCDATYLASFAMFIEALTDWKQFTNESPLLIGEDDRDTDALGESDDPKHDLVRMFKIGEVLLKFHVQSAVLFEMLIEGPVVLTQERSGQEKTAIRSRDEKHGMEPVETTRVDVQAFYASLKMEISQLEQLFVARELDASGKTVRLEPPSLGRASLLSVFTDSTAGADTASVQGSVTESLASTAYTGAAAEPLERLAHVAAGIRKGEFELYDMLKASDPDTVNDIRTRFHHFAFSAKERLRAWSLKHLTKAEQQRIGDAVFAEPEYFGNGKYAFPGSRYLLRQDEPLSIIAYSLSSREFKKELAIASKEAKTDEVRNWRKSVAAVFPHHEPFPVLPSAVPPQKEARQTVNSKGAGQLDPDADDYLAVTEPLRIITKRKKRIKEASILSLRIRSSAVPAGTGQDDGADRDGAASEGDLAITERGVDDGDIDPAAASTLSESVERNETTSSLHAPDAVPPDSASSVGSSSAGGTAHDADMERTPQPSRLLPTREGAPAPIKPYGELTPSRPSGEGHPRPVAQAHARTSPHVKHTLVSGALKISCVSWYAEEFSTLRRKWGVEEDFVASLSRSKMWSNLGGKSKSGFYLSGDDKWIAKQLLNIWTVDEKEAFLEFAPAYLQYMTSSVAQDRPTLLVKIAGVYSLKIKDVKTNEVKLKLSVQVLENVFSGDDGETIRFDLKGIRDRRACAPAKKANADGGAHKGGGDAKSDPVTSNPSVWWDGEWIETMQPRAFVKDAHKALFVQALENDLSFLTLSNMMDYSLLVGVHEANGKSPGAASFRVRIVDFLGAWTLVKQLESSSKKAIKSQTPTVIPPHEYADRFRRAMMSYFIESP